MCGIVGYFDKEGANKLVIEKMALQIRHRGPDATGIWMNDERSLAIAHRRLSILDLSSAGHQPMLSPCGRYALVYNGEIYNHLSLRIELEKEGGHFDWRGHSDTETLLAGLRHWGINGALRRLNGMFAFALWDRTERRLILARDRMGEKPLYYGHSGGSFFFGSELKSFVVHPKWEGVIDRNALMLFMRFSYVPTPWSIYLGIRKLPPAHFVVVQDTGQMVSEPKCYWDLRKVVEKGAAANKTRASVDLVDELDDLLREAVLSRMVADVPLGAFLSGGVDSATMVALMQSQSSLPVKTFTIGFFEKKYNEALFASEIARHLGTDHTELYVSSREAIAVIPKLPTIWDEPFADPSQIPTLLVSDLAREHVSVSISGDGGDELFYGYNHYAQFNQIWQILRFLPLPLRRHLAGLIRVFPGATLDRLLQFLPVRFQVPHLAERLTKLAEVVKAKSETSFYHRLVSHWDDPAVVVKGGVEPKTLYESNELHPSLPGLSERMIYLDSLTYLPDDILVKVDKSSMSVGLEGRMPLLDHRVVEFAWRVPMSLKYRDGTSKWILREVLYRYVPRELMERPKMGFAVPIDVWLRGPLREWAENLLDEQSLKNEGFFEPAPIRKKWNEYVKGTHRWHFCLWNVLMFQLWLRERL